MFVQYNLDAQIDKILFSAMPLILENGNEMNIKLENRRKISNEQ